MRSPAGCESAVAASRAGGRDPEGGQVAERSHPVQTMEWDVEASLETDALHERTGRLPATHGGATARARSRSDAGELVLGRYRIGERLGSGGFGTVYAARDERLRREVAVKAIPREAGVDDHRAEREARVAARLNHPSVVALYEIGADERYLY